MSPTMMSVRAVRAQVSKKYDKNFAIWAVERARGDRGPAPLVDVPLHPPTEATVLADGEGTRAWAQEWRAADQPGTVWAQRRWASAGTQSVPERLVLVEPTAVAAFAGHGRHWRTASARAASLVGAWPEADALPDVVRRHLRVVAGLEDPDFLRLEAVLRWLVAHPDSGMYIRQLPVLGVDTKWVSRHRGLVTALFGALTGRESLGLAQPPELFRVRFLDPELAPGGLVDVSAPLEELADLAIRPRTVFVFENLESVVAMPPVPGAVVIHGGGYGVHRLGAIPWVEQGRVVYWGDLDSDGFAILNQLRSTCPGAASILMDRTTLLEHRELWVADPSPNVGVLTRLTPAEQEVLDVIRAEGDVRLEQERLSWPSCVSALLAAAR